MSEKELNPAEMAAAAAQAAVQTCLNEGRSFRLEAGAGAGKTYSLVMALRELIKERGHSLIRNGQKIACIAYTNTAVTEIHQEIEGHPAIQVETLHAFCWAFIMRFQGELRKILADSDHYRESIAAAGGLGTKSVEYSLGFFGIDENKITVSHDDVLILTSKLLAHEKFRRLLKRAYPIIFIDEYQDTEKELADAITTFLFETGEGPTIGLFGDHWQKIYEHGCGLIEHPNLTPVDKGANFRSIPAIVNVLNQLRPELPQAFRDPDAIGEARVFHTNGWKGPRFSDRSGKDNLSGDDTQLHLDALKQRLYDEGWDLSPKSTKILMLTHNVLAKQQGYPTLPQIYDRNDSFTKKEDKHIEFLVDTVEAMCRAYENHRYGEMFNLLGKSNAVKSHADKVAWQTDIAALNALRQTATVGDVIDYLKRTGRPRLPDAVIRRETELARLGPSPAEDEPRSIQRLRLLRNVNYKEIIALAHFLEGFTPFATKHGVKGAEFENVIVVLSGDWNHYNWISLLEFFDAGVVPAKNQRGFIRARNLFYVACSRPKKRLALLYTQPVTPSAMRTLDRVFGSDAIFELNI